jgi:hypothetical protein
LHFSPPIIHIPAEAGLRRALLPRNFAFLKDEKTWSQSFHSICFFLVVCRSYLGEASMIRGELASRIRRGQALA